MGSFAYSFRNPETKAPLIKHARFYDELKKAAAGKSDKRLFFFGGGVNAGKTYLVLLCCLHVADTYPGCKIHIIRESFPSLQKTTLESFNKLTDGLPIVWKRDKSDYHCVFPNGSRIFFMGENYDADKDLNRLKGLETNFIFLEQIEELNELTFSRAMERVGRWKIAGKQMPQPIIISTFNPTEVAWVRERLYKPYVAQNLPDSWYAEFATVMDNPFVTEAELEMNKQRPEAEYKRFILGDWDAFENVRAYAYSFSRDKHVGSVRQNPKEAVVASLDFNVDPCTCVLAHVGANYLHVFKEVSLKNSNIYEMCKEIEKHVNGVKLYVTGDASGNNRSFNLTDNLTTWDIIRQNLRGAIFNVPTRNLGLNDSRTILNGTLERFDVVIDSGCEKLIVDLQTVETDRNGKIDKRNADKTHLLDGFRYICNAYFHKHFLRQ